MNLKELLIKLALHESTIELGLNLLTEIGLNTGSDEIFQATEEARHELVCQREV